ncbi:putative transmembrane protein 183BP [Musca vetustissima]|uniref:putative transmembrane protein 183BP n=1 Tax=Musca vetustissima TaxID=27455 RepID=UPI002AB76E48|nr:putative transmembrane protein 183BP [Musca vetustissima]
MSPEEKQKETILRSDFLELKPKKRRGKCLGAAEEVLTEMMNDTVITTPTYSYISNDIWFHLANHIPPEDVQRFALICKPSADCLKTRNFWMQLYQKYCQKSKDKSKWILDLPSDLQMHQLAECDTEILRQQVIKALFYCHQPFVDRLKENYKLDSLVGKIYQSSWHLTVQCVWIMVYKFCDNNTIQKNSKHFKEESTNNDRQNVHEIVNDWESLADDESNNNNTTTSHSPAASCNGLSLLIICCNHYVPFPSDFLCTNSSSTIRLQNTREFLSTDMRSTNLELEFVSLTKDQKLSWKYPQIQKYKVLPWWHPDFNRFNKCEL